MSPSISPEGHAGLASRGRAPRRYAWVSMTMLVRTEGLGLRYPGRRWGLSNLSVAVDGAAVAVLGPNGAGKSTLLSVLTGARRPTTGSAHIVGLDVAVRSARRELQATLGFVPQSMALFPGYTPAELLHYVGWLRRVPARSLPGAIAESLRSTDLESVADRKIRTLSGGMRQRLVLAQALVNSPSVVVLDEPTVGLDPEQRARFLELLVGLRDRCRVLLATHLVEDVAAVCDQVLVLDQSRAAFTGTTWKLVARAGESAVSGPAVQAGYQAVLLAGREAVAG